MWKLITDVISGAAAFFRFREKNADRLNTPEMIAAAKAAEEQKVKDDANAAVAKGDLDELRRKAAE